jgi:hypothetical protein
MTCNPYQISPNCWESKNYILRLFFFAVNNLVVVLDQTPFFKFEHMTMELEHAVLKTYLTRVLIWDKLFVLDD